MEDRPRFLGCAHGPLLEWRSVPGSGCPGSCLLLCGLPSAKSPQDLGLLTSLGCWGEAFLPRSLEGTLVDDTWKELRHNPRCGCSVVKRCCLVSDQCSATLVSR